MDQVQVAGMVFLGQVRRIGPYVPMLLFSTACLSLASVVTLLVPGLLGRAVVSLPRFVVTDWTVIGLLLLGRAAFSFTGLYALGRVAARAIVDVRRQLFSRFVLATVAFHDRSWSAELVSTLTSDAAFVHQSLGRLLPALALHVPVAIIAAVLLFTENGRLALWVALAGLPALALALAAGTSMRRLAREGQSDLGDLALVAQETFLNHKTVKASAWEEFFLARYSRISDGHLRVKYRLVFWEAAMEAFLPVCVTGVFSALWLVNRQMEAGETSPASLIAFGGYLTILGSSGLGILKGLVTLEQVTGAAQRILSLDRTKLEAESRTGRMIPRGPGELIFEAVSFDYAEDRPGIRDISLRIPPGAVVSIAGPNGAGKSTLVHLLLRLYEPHRGCIRLDGNDAREVDVVAWRRHFALVTRDPALFDLTIAENIALGSAEAGHNTVVEAAKAVRMHDAIERLPNGYDSRVGEGAVRLSAGQRQRLALARVFLQDPAIVIFDEATTSLDAESSEALMEAVKAWKGHRTLIFISHDQESPLPPTLVVRLKAGRLTPEERLNGPD